MYRRASWSPNFKSLKRSMIIDTRHHLHDKSRDNYYLGLVDHHMLVRQCAFNTTLLEVFLVVGQSGVDLDGFFVVASQFEQADHWRIEAAGIVLGRQAELGIEVAIARADNPEQIFGVASIEFIAKVQGHHFLITVVDAIATV